MVIKLGVTKKGYFADGDTQVFLKKISSVKPAGNEYLNWPCLVVWFVFGVCVRERDLCCKQILFFFFLFTFCRCANRYGWASMTTEAQLCLTSGNRRKSKSSSRKNMRKSDGEPGGS